MRVCFDLAKSGAVDAVVSAGNSGAMMACGLFVLGRVKGVERPAIVATVPTKSGRCVLLDMGANVDIRPTVLAQFAVLGSVYARLFNNNNKDQLRVGLLSNGAEEHKGTILTREAHALLERARTRPSLFDYIGYVEGRDIFAGSVDVVVTDGFTGNVLLKSLEGLAEAILQMIRDEVRRGGLLGKAGAWLMQPALRRFVRQTDYSETGGAPLVGVDGVALICHGGSGAKAIKNAILVARDLAQKELCHELGRAMNAHAFLWEDGPRDTPDSAPSTEKPS
jgi:glycerol-3-phosphate acyltransferase PlsX